MKLPKGKISGQALEDFSNTFIEHHLKAFYEKLSEFEPTTLYTDWVLLVRSIDEIINIAFELKNANDLTKFLTLDLTSLNPGVLAELQNVSGNLAKSFGDGVAKRFRDLAMMCGVLNAIYSDRGFYKLQGGTLNFSDTANSINYLQSRRAYYFTLLNLIPKISSGKKTIKYTHILNSLQLDIDNHLVNITTAYYNLLLNESLKDFELESDGSIAKRNFEYNHLESFFLEPV